jgi:hypothetical protein
MSSNVASLAAPAGLADPATRASAATAPTSVPSVLRPARIC